MSDELSPRAREFLEAARLDEPSLDDAARARMRARLLGAAGGLAVGTLTATTAKAAGTASASAASLTTAALVKTAAIVVVTASLVGAGYAVGPSLFASAPVPTTALVSRTAPSSIARPPSAPQESVPRKDVGVETVADARLIASAAPASNPPTPSQAPRTTTSAPPDALAREPSPSTPATASPTSAAGPDANQAPTQRGARAGGARRAEPAAEGARGTTAEGADTGSETTGLATSTARPADGSFAADVAALDRARAAVSAGEHAKALEAIEGSGTSPIFAEEKAALRVVALCAVGRKSEGRAALDKFRTSFPKSLQTTRAIAACREP